MVGQPSSQRVVTVGLGRKEPMGPNPYLAAGLALLVGALVFALLWRFRKTFGLKL